MVYIFMDFVWNLESLEHSLFFWASGWCVLSDGFIDQRDPCCHIDIIPIRYGCDMFPNFPATMDSSGQHAVTPFSARIVFVCFISRKPAGRLCIVVSLWRVREGSLTQGPEISKYSGENGCPIMVSRSPYRFPPSPRFVPSAWVKTADLRSSLIQSGWAKLGLGRVVWRGWTGMSFLHVKHLGPVWTSDFICCSFFTK